MYRSADLVDLHKSELRWEKWRLLLTRPIVQLFGALIITGFVPAYLRVIFTDTSIDNQWLLYTLLIVCAVIVVSFVTFTNLAKFPNVTEASFIFVTLAAWYSIAAVILLLMRFRYSGFLFITSFILSVLWFYFCYFWTLSVRLPRFAIIPGGSAANLLSVPGAYWSQLTEPRINGEARNGVVADLRADFAPEWERFITDLSLAGIPVFHTKQVAEMLTGRVEIEHLSENNFGSLVPGLTFIGIKRIIDFIAAATLLVVLAPVILLIALAIRHDSSGPVFFRQKRVGYRGQIFSVYKFRTMTHDANAKDDAVEPHKYMTVDGDERVTRVGRWLRKKRFDELPQVLNVLRGEMSFIGPRPEALALSRWYERELPFYRYRHIVRPGISGWAQINLGHVTEMDLVLGKLHYDFYYIKNFSPWLDILITLKTMGIMANGNGAR